MQMFKKQPNTAAKARAERDAKLNAITTVLNPSNVGAQSHTWKVKRGNAVIGTIERFIPHIGETHPYKAFVLVHGASAYMVDVFYGPDGFKKATDAIANAR